MQGNDRWPPATNPSARLRAARVMPQWITARGTALPPPPPPPVEEPPPPVEPEYEVIEFPGQQTYSNQPIIRKKEKKRCDLCGSSAPAVKCMQCAQQNFCYSCDEMYHRHPKRQSHIRKELDGGGGRPPLPPKGEPPPPPVPPPRRNKRATPRPTPTPPLLPPGPHIMQRESVSPKPGLMGSLKKIIGVRPQPGISHTMDRQNSLPANSSLMGFHDQHMMNCNGFPDWSEMHRGHRAGSFSTLNSPAFGHMMQAQSVAHLNCPGCHGHGMWSPWGGMPPTGTWQSSNFLNRGPPKEEWSDSDSDHAWQRERLRRFSTVSARVPRGYDCDETQSVRGGRRTDLETSSHKGGRRRDFDTLSNRGGRKQDFDTISNRGGRKQDLETMSNRGGRKQDFDTMSLRGGRRSDLESPSFRSQKKYIEDRSTKKLIDDRYRNDRDDSESTDERESEEEFVAPRHSRKVMSDLEDMQRSRRRSQPPSPLPVKKSENSLKKKNKRNERFTDTGRRRSSPVQYKYESPSGDENELIVENGQETNEKVGNGIEAVEDEPEEEEELGPIPDSEWECAHCTFVNEGGSRVCAVCCKTTNKPKLLKSQGPPSKESQSPLAKTSQSPSSKLEDEVKNRLNIEEKAPREEPPKNMDKSEKMKEKRGTQSPERNRTLTSKGTSPPPQSISTQTYEEVGQKLKRATSLADYSDWKPPQRSASRQSLLSDTQSLPVTPPRSRSPEQFRREVIRRSSDLFSQRSHKRAGSQPPEYISTLVQKQVKQGLEMVKLLREAEEHQFSAEDLAVALLHCGDGDPIIWLQDNWRNMIDTVVTLGTNYGQERKENTVGTISASEAREALRSNDGNVWAAVTECVEQRQRKYGELLSRGNFSREDIVTALTATHGNVEEAYKELTKNQLKPFLMRIWGPPQGADNDDGDFTKLAHGNMVGRGEKNSEEVSVDLSTDTNYERIQNWLEDHVYNSNKISHSQSMLQLNLGGLNRSESEWKFNPQNSTNNISSNSKNMHNSDVQRFLKSFYNSNNKSLFIKDHSISTLNLNEMNSYSNLNFTKNKEPSVSLSDQQNDGTGENNETEVETITIKLNPTIVRIEGNNQSILQTEERNREKKNVQSSSEESESEESESEESESDSDLDLESHTNELSNDYSNTLKADNELLNAEAKSFKESSSVSGSQSEKSAVEDGIIRSSSESSSESFESVHSSVDDNHGIIQPSKHKKDNPMVGEDDEFSRESSLTNEYANISFENLFKKGKDESSEAKLLAKSSITNERQENVFNDVIRKKNSAENLLNTKHHNIREQKQITNDEQANNTSISNELLHTKPEKNRASEKEGNSSKVAKTVIPNATKQNESRNIRDSNSLAKEALKSHQAKDFSSSSNDSEEKFVEVSSDDEIPFIEETNESASLQENIQQAVPIAIEDDSDDDSNFHSSEVPYIINKEILSRNKKEEVILSENTKNLIVPEKKRVISKRNKDFYKAPKSDSDINDEQSIEFSEESVDYNEGRHLSPITPILLRSDTNLRFSEANSDKDVSSIPTDSEKESYFDGRETISFKENIKRNLDEIRNTLPTNHTELLELLRKSLTKEDVVERLVSTLFATVLQASVETNIIKDNNELDNSTNDLKKESLIQVSSVNREHQDVVSINDEKGRFILYDDITGEQLIDEIEPKDEISSGNEIKIEGIGQVNFEESDHLIMNEEDKTINQVDNVNESQFISSEDDIHNEIMGYTNKNQNVSKEGNVSEEENVNEDNMVNSEETQKEIMRSFKEDSSNHIMSNMDNENNDNANILNSHENKNNINNSNANENKDNVNNLNANKNKDNVNNSIANENNDNVNNLNANENKDNVNNLIANENKGNVSNLNSNENKGNVSNLNANENKDNVSNLNANENKDNANNLNAYENKDNANNLNANENKDNANNLNSNENKDNANNLNFNENKDNVSNLNANESKEPLTNPLEKEDPVITNTITKVKGNLIKNREISGKRKLKNSSEKVIKEIQTKKIAVITQENIVQECVDFTTTNSSEKIPHKGSDNVSHDNVPNQEAKGNVTTSVNSTRTSPIDSVLRTDNVNSEASSSKLKEIIQSQDLADGISETKTEDNSFSPEREARRLLAEGLVSTYEQAEIAVQLKELNIEEDMILSAAKECNSLETAIAFLQQECQLCAGKYSVKEIVSMLECEHRCCMECARNYFTLQITERNINDCVCPFCKEPDILHIEEDKALTYFSHLDIFLKGIVKENIHELFQRKLRDRTLMQDPNFKWCVKCSSGYIANPRQKRLICPDCKAITCAKCMKPWEKEHEKMSCEEYNEWLQKNDPDHQFVEKHLDENGVTCPNCKSKYILAKGGCMHLTCPQCKHEFCSGCTKPFLMGKSCKVSDYCEKLGLHSHHPRNCLFYLRDKEPEELEKLLEDNNIEFRRNDENDAKRCGVQMLKETSDGLVEGTCGYTTLKAGLCRRHYVERLAKFIRESMLETMNLLDEDDLETVVRRTGRKPPPNPYGTPRHCYRAALVKVYI